jgi:hypothetical protein
MLKDIHTYIHTHTHGRTHTHKHIHRKDLFIGSVLPLQQLALCVEMVENNGKTVKWQL